MANLHRTADLHSMAILCPTVGLWPTWPFPPQQLQVPVVLRVLQGGPCPMLAPSPLCRLCPWFPEQSCAKCTCPQSFPSCALAPSHTNTLPPAGARGCG